MEKTNYTINEYGEIIREDYFFTSVKGTNSQVLPTNRKVWKIWLLSFITLGIYGLLVMFAMSKETNIACAEDGKHTRGFWGALFLSTITLGIYGFVWHYKWADREFAYLCRQKKEGGVLRGVALFFMMVVTFVISLLVQYTSSIYQYTQSGDSALLFILLYIFQIIWGIFVMSRYVKQHNEVNRIYNLNTFGQKA